MNSIQAKQLNLPDLLRRLGHEPTEVKKNGQEYWYRSPFREETDASFHTSYLGGKWIWNDFGDIGGTVIDFVMRHENLSRVKDALQFLDKLYHHNPEQTHLFREKSGGERPVKQTPPTLFSFQQQGRQAPDTDSELEMLKVQPLQNPLIFSYLTQTRKIPRNLAIKYLKQVHYRHKPTGKNFFAMGIENRSGGYEIRIASDDYGFTKSSLRGKDITVIPGIEPGKGNANVFEGMIDCLSLMAMYNVQQLKGDCIILNTTKHASKAADFIQSQGYKGINTFLDNDRAGEDCLAQLQESLEANFVHPQNQLYDGFRDVNEALVSQYPKLAIGK